MTKHFYYEQRTRLGIIIHTFTINRFIDFNAYSLGYIYSLTSKKIIKLKMDSSTIDIINIINGILLTVRDSSAEDVYIKNQNEFYK